MVSWHEIGENLFFVSFMKVQIYILTHNRPDTFARALKSVETQDFDDFEIVVSDNSSNDDTLKLFYSMEHPCNVRYIRRDKEYPPFDHFTLCRSEITADYYMLFHDDDEMCPNMIRILYNTIIEKNNIVAVGSNAYIVKNGNLKRRCFLNMRNNLNLFSTRDIIIQYIKRQIVPYPSYMYNTALSKELKHNISDGGKYSDTSYIASLANYGQITFVAKPLMKYYFYKEQDSSNHDYFQFASLIKFYSKNGFSKEELIPVRVDNLYNEYKRQCILNYKSFSFKRVIRLFYYSKNMGSKYFLRGLLTIFNTIVKNH